MTPRRVFVGLFLAIGLVLSPVAMGQETNKRSESHVRIPFDGRNWKELQERFQSFQDAQREELLKNLKDYVKRIGKNRKDLEAWSKLNEITQSQSFKDLKNQLKNSQDDKQKAEGLMQDQSFKDLVQEMSKSKVDNKELKEFAQTPAVRNLLNELGATQSGLTREKSQPLDDSERQEAVDLQKTGDVPGNLPQGTKGNSNPGQPAERQQDNDGPHFRQDSDSPPTGKSTPPSQESTPGQSLRHWLAEHINPNQGLLAESPAIQEVVRELRRSSFAGEPPAADHNGLAGRFARWGESLTKSEAWSKVDWSNLKNWLPSSQSMPKLDSPISAPSFGGVPDVITPSVKVVDRGLQILCVVLSVAAGILVWKLLGGYIPGVAQSRNARAGWKLGPWPVRPGEVSNRKDVIQAFEYLSLLRVGPKAQSQNHLELAAHLGQSTSQHTQSANRLAAVYEQARYAPTDDPLSSDALAAARSELTFLAGVKA